MKYQKELTWGLVALVTIICFLALARPMEDQHARTGAGNQEHQDQDLHQHHHQRQQQLMAARHLPRLFCFILSMNTEENRRKAMAVRHTWAGRCDKFLLITNGTKLRESDDTLTIPMHEGRDQLWHKVILATKYVYDKYLDDYDWFLKADDDTYVLVDTLKTFLADRSDPAEPVYYGHRFKPFVRQGYMSGGSGYALSREALRRLVELGLEKMRSDCNIQLGSVEDVEIGRCLEAVGVRAGDSRDPLGRETFLPLPPTLLLSGKLTDDFWLSKYEFYKHNMSHTLGNMDWCSDRPVSFHYIEPEQMFLIDWLLYGVKRNA